LLQDDDTGLSIELTCPKGATCASAEIYKAQVAALQHIIVSADGAKVDSFNQACFCLTSCKDDICSASWFASPLDKVAGDWKAGSIYVCSIGFFLVSSA
jgi:hypothetical protein